MSIHMLTLEEALKRAIHETGELVPWRPTRRGFGSIRILALEGSLDAEIKKPWGDDDSRVEALRQRIITTFDNFVGDRFALPLVFKQTSKGLGTAAMRILSPRPGARVMGGFVSDTVFVGTSAWPRDNLPFKHKPAQTKAAKISHKELNERTAKRLNELLGDAPLYRPPSLRR